MAKAEWIPVQVLLPPKMVDDLEDLAAKAQLRRADIIRNMLRGSLKRHRDAVRASRYRQRRSTTDSPQ